MSKRWYVLHAKSGAEKKLIDQLRERLVKTNYEEFVGDILVPTEEVVELRQGQKRKSERKFFPGYVLIHMEMSDEIWHIIRRTPGVLGFLGGSKPSPIPDADADRILKRLEEDSEQPKPKFLFEPGEVIRVTEGPFADFNGVVEEVNYEKNRLRVAVLIFGRSTPVELEFSQVEKA